MKSDSLAESKKLIEDCLNYLRFQRDMVWEGLSRSDQLASPAGLFNQILNPSSFEVSESKAREKEVVLPINKPETVYVLPKTPKKELSVRQSKKTPPDKGFPLSDSVQRTVPITQISSQIAGLTLKDIRQAMGNCQLCRLHQDRKNLVFGVGCEHSKLVFVGEAPGRDEDIKGEPFVGRAGQLLTKIINAMGLKREEVYITNIVKCRPPGNRNPLPDEIAVCEPFLIQQMEIIKPKLICALGNVAAQILLKTNKTISLLRGQFYYYRGIKLIPTFHPAFLLRSPEYKKVVWEDMQLLLKDYKNFED